jgi:hypothetical protein
MTKDFWIGASKRAFIKQKKLTLNKHIYLPQVMDKVMVI